MANNEYVNRVDFGDETLIDISDTTAEPEDVIEGQTFYTRNGAPATGTLGDATITTHGLMSATDKVKLDEIDSKKAPIIIDSKSGNPIVINDGVPGLKLYGMKVSFSPKQAGTGDPSPTNIRPITGWDGVNIHQSGKNLLDVNDAKKLAYNSNYSNWSSENGIVAITGNATGGYIMPCFPETQYTYSFESTYIGENLAVRVYEFTEYPTVLSSGVLIVNDNSSVGRNVPPKSFSTTSTGKWLVVGFYAHHSENITIQKMQIEFGSTATEYEPYSDETISVSWQTEAGTVYGGELDVLTGTLTVEWIFNSVRWGDIKISTEGSVSYGYVSIDDIIYQASETGGNKSNISNIAKWTWSGMSDTTPHFFTGKSQDGTNKYRAYFYLPSDTAEDTTIEWCAKLVTPYTIQITSSQVVFLNDNNTIWTDANNIIVSYPIDTKKYVDAGARDVYINGTSILDKGVANIPIMTSSVSGVAKVGNGLGMSSSGQLRINSAADSYLKTGSDLYYPVVPGRQHTSVFYGLAKLAGVDLANETVTLGQYPSTALIAIQKMLGIYQAPWEIINEETFTNATSEDHIISVDSYGQPFELVEAIMLFELPKLSVGDVDSSKGTYGQIWFIYDNGAKHISPEPGAFSRVTGGDAKGSWYYIQNNNGLVVSMATLPATDTNSGALRLRYIHNSWSGMGILVDDGTFAITSVNIKRVTGNAQYRLYGRRKWN